MSEYLTEQEVRENKHDQTRLLSMFLADWCQQDCDKCYRIGIRHCDWEDSLGCMGVFERWFERGAPDD